MPQAAASANTNGAVILADEADGVPSLFQSLLDKAAPVIAYQKAECEKYGWGRIALYFVITWVLQFLAAWQISKLLAPKHGTARNTARLFLYGMLSGGVFLILAFICFRTDSFGILLALIFVLMVVNFVIVMVVYHMGFFKTIGFEICYLIAASLISLVPQLFLGRLPWQVYAKLRPEERLAIYQEWNTKIHDGKPHDPSSGSPSPAPGAASAPATAPSTGPTDVRAMYERLQSERAKLDTKDPAAVAQFNQHAAEYAALNARLAAAASPAPVAPSKKPKATPAGKN